MQQPVFRVGQWLVTPSDNQISRNGRQLTLEPRLIDLLVFFAHHPDEMLSRDELIDNVWTRTVVTSHVVTQSISELRKSLKDGEEGSLEYIMTVPKRGYKLTAPVVWCTIEDEAPAPVMVSAAGELVGPTPAAEILQDQPPSMKPAKPKRIDTFCVWLSFLLALGSCVALVTLSTMQSQPSRTNARLLLNPRDIDIRLLKGHSCVNRTSQDAYAVGLGSLMTTSMNTFSTFMVHDKTNYNVSEPSSSGKTLTIEFVNQRHYRAQQCFMSVQLVDNADGSTMMDKRYFITSDNQLSIQSDLLSSLSEALKLQWPDRMLTMLKLYQPSHGSALIHFYQAHQLLMNGDVDSLDKASALLDDVLADSPDFSYALAEKILVDVSRHSQQTLDKEQLKTLYAEVAKLGEIPGTKDLALYYQIKTIYLLEQGKTDDACNAINSGINLEMSWMNYVLLGKVYEMKGKNREAADAYLTAFNLRPGDNTFYWIQNAVFQTSVTSIVPYLNNFLTS